MLHQQIIWYRLVNCWSAVKCKVYFVAMLCFAIDLAIGGWAMGGVCLMCDGGHQLATWCSGKDMWGFVSSKCPPLLRVLSQEGSRYCEYLVSPSRGWSSAISLPMGIEGYSKRIAKDIFTYFASSMFVSCSNHPDSFCVADRWLPCTLCPHPHATPQQVFARSVSGVC